MSDRYRTWFPLVAERLRPVDFRTLPGVIKVFVAVIVAFVVLRWFAPDDLTREIVLLFGTNLFEGGRFVPAKLYSLFTRWALHGSFLHAFFNTVIFIFVGQCAYRHLGTVGFAAFVLPTDSVSPPAAEVRRTISR